MISTYLPSHMNALPTPPTPTGTCLNTFSWTCLSFLVLELWPKCEKSPVDSSLHRNGLLTFQWPNHILPLRASPHHWPIRVHCDHMPVLISGHPPYASVLQPRSSSRWSQQVRQTSVKTFPLWAPSAFGYHHRCCS